MPDPVKPLREQRFLTFLAGALDLLKTDGGHLLLLSAGVILCFLFYKPGIGPVGGALFLKIKA